MIPPKPIEPFPPSPSVAPRAPATALSAADAAFVDQLKACVDRAHELGVSLRFTCVTTSNRDLAFALCNLQSISEVRLKPNGRT